MSSSTDRSSDGTSNPGFKVVLIKCSIAVLARPCTGDSDVEILGLNSIGTAGDAARGPRGRFRLPLAYLFSEWMKSKVSVVSLAPKHGLFDLAHLVHVGKVPSHCTSSVLLH